MFVKLNGNENKFRCEISENCSGTMMSHLFGHLCMSDTLKKLNGQNNCSIQTSYYHGGHNYIYISGENVLDLKGIFLVVSWVLDKFSPDQNLDDPYKGEITRIKIRMIQKFFSSIYSKYLEFKLTNLAPNFHLTITGNFGDEHGWYGTEGQVEEFYKKHESFFKRGFLNVGSTFEEIRQLREVFSSIRVGYKDVRTKPLLEITLRIDEEQQLILPQAEHHKTFVCELTQYGRTNFKNQLQNKWVDPKCFAMSPSETKRLKEFIGFAMQMKQFIPITRTI